MNWLLLLLSVLVTVNSAVSRYTDKPEGVNDTPSVPEIPSEESVARLQKPHDEKSANAISLREDDIKAFLASESNVWNFVSGEKHDNENSRPVWRDSLVTSPSALFDSASVWDTQSQLQSGRVKRSQPSSPDTVPEPGVQREDTENTESSAKDGRAGPRRDKITIAINAVKGPRRHRRRQSRRRHRNARTRSLNDQQNDQRYYPSRRYSHSSRHSTARSRTPSPTAEALAVLTQKMASLEVELVRLKEVLLLQGAVHIKTSERMENMMLAQGKLALRNEATSRRVLGKVKECCGCSPGARRPPGRRTSSRRGDDEKDDDGQDGEDGGSEEGNSSEEGDSSEERDSSEEGDSGEEMDLRRQNDMVGEQEEKDSNEDSSEERDSRKHRYSRKKKKKGSSEEDDSSEENDSSEEKGVTKSSEVGSEKTVPEDRDSSEHGNRRRHKSRDESKEKDKISRRKDKKKHKHNHSRKTQPQTTASTATPQATNILSWVSTTSPRTTTPVPTTTSSKTALPVSTKSAKSENGAANTIPHVKPNNIILSTSSPIQLGQPNFENEIRLQNDENRPSNKSASPDSNAPDHDVEKGKNKDEGRDPVTTATTTTLGHVISDPHSTADMSTAGDLKHDPHTPQHPGNANHRTAAKESLTQSSTLSSSDEASRGMPATRVNMTNNNSQRENSDRYNLKPHESDDADAASKTGSTLKENTNTHKHGSNVAENVFQPVSVSAKMRHPSTLASAPTTSIAADDVDIESSTTTTSTTSERILTTTPATTTTTEAPRNLSVDLSTGVVENYDLPGVEWVVTPSKPTRRSSRRRWRRSSRTTHEDRLCAMQGVLKFTFSPPAAADEKSSTPDKRSRGGRHRGRHRRSNEGGDGGAGDDVVGGRKLMLELEFQRPKRWVFNLGDSIANNGFSGDGSVQENDCEVQGYGTSFAVYGSDKHPNGRQKLLRMYNTFIYHKVTLTVSDEALSWDNHRGNKGTVKDPSLFALSGQSDNQGAVNYDVFLGLNRVIAGNYRHGHGLCRLEARWLE